MNKNKIYEWNVRVIKNQSTFAEFIVEAKTKKEAEAKINAEKDVADDHWNPDIQTDVFIQSDYTERMDKILPDRHINPDEEE
jgi:hypothetical protein